MTTLIPSKFGPYGGQFVPETLMPALIELEAAFVASRDDSEFQSEFGRLMASFVGRPTPITHARRLSEKLGGAQIYLKREDLAHTGAHKINNALGQALLAKQMGKKRLIAETGAGQHGVASATAAALLGLDCVVYMGCVDIERQKPNVHRMELLGAEVRPVTSGTRTLKDAINEAIRDWVANVADTHLVLEGALARLDEGRALESRPVDVEREHIAMSMGVGLRYLAAAPIVRRILWRGAMFAVPASALWALLPEVADRHFGLDATGYGGFFEPHACATGDGDDDDAVERRHGGVDAPRLEHRPHVAEEQGEQQCADVGTVHVCVGHGKNFIISGFTDVEVFSYTGPNGRN